MKCFKCNFENPQETDQCSKCGAPLIGVTAKIETGSHNRVDPLDFAPGEMFGKRYQVIEEIGKGGMGKVFKARDLELDIVVALKMIKPELSSDPSIVTRFKRELLLAREILHENVIRIHDLGEIENIKYISMNYIQGNSLKEILQSTGKLTIEKSIEISKQVCQALNAAHTKGIVHRDLKPQNIMIDKKGNAFVLDFGIARSVTSAGETEAGIVLGTPNFISPEQIQGKPADGASDIYSLGIIMYEMVTGELPFKAESPTALLYKHLNEAPIPPSKLNPQIPRKLEKIILKCLEKKKANRYRSLTQILDELELDKTGQIRLLKERSGEKKSIDHSHKRSRISRLVTAILVLLLLVYGAISILSLVKDNDNLVKLEKIKVEDETYFKNRFPITKTWLPGDWENSRSNAWDIYLSLFPPLSDPAGKPIPHEQYIEDDYIKKILMGPDAEKISQYYKSPNYEDQAFEEAVGQLAEPFKFADLSEALHRVELNPYPSILVGRSLSSPVIKQYARMMVLTARADFIKGQYKKGIDTLEKTLLLTQDLLSASSSLEEDRAAIYCFHAVCRELIPLLLSLEQKIEPPSTPINEEEIEIPGQEVAKIVEPETQEAKDTAISMENEEQNAITNPEETIEQVEAPPTPEELKVEMLIPLNNLVNLILKKLEPREMLYKEYLAVSRDIQDIPRRLGIKKWQYHLLGKLEYWKQGFSINQYFYQKSIRFFQEMFEDLKYIQNMRARSIFIKNHTLKSAPLEHIVKADIPGLAFNINVARTLGKLVLLIHHTREFGMNSIEFSNLRGTENFINEFSGKTFEISEKNGSSFLELGQDFKLNLARINYTEKFAEILISFNRFEIKSEGQIRSLFNSLELE